MFLFYVGISKVFLSFFFLVFVAVLVLFLPKSFVVSNKNIYFRFGLAQCWLEASGGILFSAVASEYYFVVLKCTERGRGFKDFIVKCIRFSGQNFVIISRQFILFFCSPFGLDLVFLNLWDIQTTY